MNDTPNPFLGFMIAVFSATVFMIFVLFCLSSCTISFQNISTHGSATDLVDENQDASPQIDAKVTIPVSPI